MTRVIVHIDELVLRGFPPEDRHLISEGLSAGMARLCAESPEVLRSLHALTEQMTPTDGARLRLGGVSVGDAQRPVEVGERLGAHLFRGILGGGAP